MAIGLNLFIPVFTTIEEYVIEPWIRRVIFHQTCLLLYPYELLHMIFNNVAF